MQKFAGILIFSGSWLNRPWKLIQENGKEVDLYPLIDDLLLKMNGRPAFQDYKDYFYSLELRDSSDHAVEYEPDKSIILKKIGKFGMSNIGAHLPSMFTYLSGRKVNFEINETGFKVAADPNDDVFGVKFLAHGNGCRIPEGSEKTVCKVGTSDCCIFLSGTARGFSCQKFNTLGMQLLARHHEGTMRASHVGNCKTIGREESTLPKSPPTPPMSLSTKSGEKVLFNRPDAGHEHNIESAQKYLTYGSHYTVERIKAGSWSSEVFFEEVPGISFNTVHFENVQEATAEANA